MHRLTICLQHANTDKKLTPAVLYTDNLQVAYPNEEQQNSEDENVYTPLGKDEEEYDTILTSSSSVAIVNRPPAPTPRPDSLPTPDDKTPFIAQGLNFLFELWLLDNLFVIGSVGESYF